MKLSLLVLSPPSSDASHHAYQFAKAAAESGHTLFRIFFYRDGVLHSSPNGYTNREIHLDWKSLSDKHNADLVVCSTAAEKRGIASDPEPSNPNSQSNLLLPGFTLSGLGQLTEACVDSDRTITFG